MSTKPNCYECKYRYPVPGDAHSRCGHPVVNGKDGNLFDVIMMAIKGELQTVMDKLQIRCISDHAVRSGWFMWPLNFDPIWLESCNGFTKKEESPCANQ